MLRLVAGSLMIASLLSVVSTPSRQGSAAQQGSSVRDNAPHDLRIEWVGGTSHSAAKTPAEAREALEALAAEGVRRHFIVQFSRPLDHAERERVHNCGITLLSYLGNHGYFATARSATLETGLLTAVPLVDARPAQRAWKLHPMLERGQVPDWTVVESKNGSHIVGTYVLFHPDVTLNEQGEVIRRHDGVVRDVIESVNGMVVELSFDNIKALSVEDPVQYVEPALPRMGTTNDSIRALTGVDTVQAAPYGLDGSGVSAMVYDGGTAFASHVDFGGRLTTRDSDSLSTHATHVSGTVGGNGAASGGTNRGMAPGVLIESYGFEYDGSGTFLYTNPGDFEADYGDAIVNWGADVSNNSIGTNTETNGFDCAFQGNYGLMSSLIDAVVRGSVSGGVPHRIVWAAGNERQGSRCDVEGFGDYYSTAPPAGAKNHLSIGALNSNDDSMTSFSSWGPTDDGRLKPDFSAPGCQNGGDGGVTSCSASSTTSYTVFCGTSMASPTVTGIVALMLQDYRAQFPGPDPRNSTLKALLAHTAVDILNTGPDYQSGYGSVRAPAAIDFMRQENFTESEISQGETLLYTVSVAPGDTELKITLAWSDVPGTPNVTTALVNDLDLHVFSPSSVEHFPWTLNPLIPADLAVQTARDHLNNIEQIQANSPEVGVWLVEIRGFNVPQGPQSFSLCASPNLINCASQGLIALDRSTYTCSSTASVTVVDCDLNTDDFVSETIDVTVSSTSEPGGETLTLTESGTATATFFATLPFSTVDSPGVLQVSEGDSVDTLYIDADDGNGNMGVMNTASAGVDCTAPIISNVLVTDVTHIGATIEFDTDEASSALVDFGVDCGLLTEQALAFTPTLHHVVQLGGLNDGQSYAFTVTATDPAGNPTTDDNAGGCYDFMTDDVPDYFAEQFSSFDLDGLSVTFVPNGSNDSYVACTQTVSSFPNNPAGGTTLPLSDDDSEFVSIAGGQTVKLYGVSYGSFYVGSNGYITFTTPDTDYTESLSDHFDTPRVSANFDDYNPSSAGIVSWKQLSDRMVVTWENVTEYGTSNSNSFQVELLFDGTIRITYQGMASTDGVAGLSEGTGLPATFLPSDISGYPMASCSCLPAMVLTRTAAGNLTAYTATPPVLGGTMIFTVLAPYSNGVVLATAGQADILLANGQSLLVDTGASFLFSSAIVGLPFGTGQMNVPSDPALCGRSAATQAILIGPTAGGPPFQLTNAQDVTIGS